MTTARNAPKALVLHLVGGGEPIRIAVSEETATELEKRLERLLGGSITSVIAANGASVAINYAQVAVAHLERLRPNAQVYGSPAPQ
ncbi:hypothetical protein F0L68_25350 [Solihabitans fulvus]|uniref:Uncharacterized protein n=1 Tax=Solihabitans fulvus TaxID=1892852 RepID=A0A5B2X1I9_9PSEU|nr:hypothetical protein [Solihabitans fulvus]KAA2257076.1 hypothetical protein F0L68_25350 [Solihabitans fulvus]